MDIIPETYIQHRNIFEQTLKRYLVFKKYRSQYYFKRYQERKLEIDLQFYSKEKILLLLKAILEMNDIRELKLVFSEKYKIPQDVIEKIKAILDTNTILNRLIIDTTSDNDNFKKVLEILKSSKYITELSIRKNINSFFYSLTSSEANQILQIVSRIANLKKIEINYHPNNFQDFQEKFQIIKNNFSIEEIHFSWLWNNKYFDPEVIKSKNILEKFCYRNKMWNSRYHPNLNSIMSQIFLPTELWMIIIYDYIIKIEL